MKVRAINLYISMSACDALWKFLLCKLKREALKNGKCVWWWNVGSGDGATSTSARYGAQLRGVYEMGTANHIVGWFCR